MKKWLAGHKASFAAWTVVLVAALVVFFGKLSPAAALGISIFGVGLFAESYREDLQRHQKETLQVLREIAAAGQAASVRNIASAVQFGTQAVEDGTKLAEECEQESKG